MTTTIITGEAGSQLAAPLTFGALFNATTITSAVLRASGPKGVPVVTWAVTIEAQTATSVTLVHTIPVQLADGKWHVRPFPYVGGVLVTSVTFKSLQIIVARDPVTAP